MDLTSLMRLHPTFALAMAHEKSAMMFAASAGFISTTAEAKARCPRLPCVFGGTTAGVGLGLENGRLREREREREREKEKEREGGRERENAGLFGHPSFFRVRHTLYMRGVPLYWLGVPWIIWAGCSIFNALLFSHADMIYIYMLSDRGCFFLALGAFSDAAGVFFKGS